jgi:formamidopyrimidine-DNA glycosylase
VAASVPALGSPRNNRGMPEMPEVESLTRFLTEKCVGRVIARVDLAAFSALKTYDPPLSALSGLEIDGVTRHGKFIDISAGGLHLVFHLARCAGRTSCPPVPPGPARDRSRYGCGWTTTPAST